MATKWLPSSYPGVFQDIPRSDATGDDLGMSFHGRMAFRLQDGFHGVPGWVSLSIKMGRTPSVIYAGCIG